MPLMSDTGKAWKVGGRKPGYFTAVLTIILIPEGERRNAMKIVLFLILFLSTVVVTPLQAQEKSKDEVTAPMGEVVVTATRDTQETRKTPANITVITAEEIKKSGATTIVEALSGLESIQIRDFSGNSTQAYIDMRGMGGDNPFGKTLIMLDGRKINRPDMSSINWLQIPVNSVERIEIVRGAGSVLYGDAAIGGVINIITRKGRGKPQVSAAVMAGSYNLHNERVGITGATDKWSYALTGENNFNFGYRERSKYAAQSGGMNLSYDAGELFSVALGVSFNKTDYQMPGALTKDQMSQDRRQYQPAMPLYFMNATPDNDGSDKYTNVNLEVKSYLGEWGQLDINFLYGKKDLQMNMPSWSSYNFADTDATTFGITPKYILEKKIAGISNKLIAGVDYYQEPYKKDFYSTRERTARVSYADFTRESLGWYIRDEVSPLKNLIFHAGCRLERAKIKGSNTDISAPANDFTGKEKTYTAEAYEAGVTALWGKKAKTFARYSTVYRIPFLDEVASFNGFGGGVFLTELEKEKGSSLEAGMEVYPLDKLKIGLTLFRIDMEDEIRWVATSLWTGENRNVGKTRHEGAEFSASWLWEKSARFYGNATYHLATFENGVNNKKEMPLVPNRMASAGVEIYLPYNTTLRTEVRHVGDCFLSGDDDNSTEKLESYTLLNIYLSHKRALCKLNMTAFFGADNLADVKYSSYGIDYAQYWMPNFYYPMPGIVFKGGLSIEY